MSYFGKSGLRFRRASMDSMACLEKDAFFVDLARERDHRVQPNSPKLSISSMPNKAFAPCACGASV